MTEDKVMTVSIALFELLDGTAIKYNIPEEAIDTFKTLYMDIVADIVMHFCKATMPNKEGFEMWKHNMGLSQYCGGAIDELEHEECWDVNWFKNEYGIDLTEAYAELYNSFINIC